MEEPPKAVPVTANQFGYDPLRWAWAEPTVWTERMLTALEQGVKGNRWFSLIDKVYSPRCLTAAAFQVEANEGAAGVDHVSVKSFGDRRDAEVAKLSEQLRTGTYRPQAVRRVHIPKPGTKEKRPLGPVFHGNKGTVRDRVVGAFPFLHGPLSVRFAQASAEGEISKRRMPWTAKYGRFRNGGSSGRIRRLSG